MNSKILLKLASSTRDGDTEPKSILIPNLWSLPCFFSFTMVRTAVICSTVIVPCVMTTSSNFWMAPTRTSGETEVRSVK